MCNGCRVARECLAGGRPLYQRLRRRGFNRDGRTDRASLQRAIRLVRPYKGLYVSCVLYFTTRLSR